MFHLPRMRITRPYRTSVALEEERVWVGFYRRVDNPVIAAEVIQHLDAEPDLKRTHPALYLRCKECVRQRKARQTCMKRIRGLIRTMLRGLLRDRVSLMRQQRRHRADIVVKGLPESMAESGQHKLKSLPKAAEFAAARQGELPQSKGEEATLQ